MAEGIFGESILCFFFLPIPLATGGIKQK
jgi:hypothetical protein